MPGCKSLQFVKFPFASNSAGTGILGGSITSEEPSGFVIVTVPSGPIICEPPSGVPIISPGPNASVGAPPSIAPAS